MLQSIRHKFVTDKNIGHTIKNCLMIDFVGWGLLGGGVGGGFFSPLPKKNAGTAFAFSVEILADFLDGE